MSQITLTYEDLNDQQRAAIDDIVRWYQNSREVTRYDHNYADDMDSLPPIEPYILQGYAGTGKTTLLRILMDRLSIPLPRIALCAPTNRAAKVLANKTGLFTQTVHKLIYITLSEEINFQRERLRIWDEATSFTQLGELLITQSGQNLEEQFEQGMAEDYGTNLAEWPTNWREQRETFKAERAKTILTFEGIELPDDLTERNRLFDTVKAERMKEHKDTIIELMGEDLQVRKKDSAEVSGKYSLLMVDESSMVDEAKGRDILSFRVPTIMVGDPFQLPPVKAKAFWHDRRPQSVLTKIERQKGPGAGIPLAGERLRKGNDISSNESLRIHPRNSLPDEAWGNADQIICGTHKTRERLCRFVRRLLGYDTVEPQPGEKVVAVYNDKKNGIMNGELYTVVSAELTRGGSVTRMHLKDPYGIEIGPIDAWTKGFEGRQKTSFLDDQFGKFWWGYAITCHQSQGSEWKNIIVCDDWPGDGHDRWLYTGITRAAIKCDLVR